MWSKKFSISSIGHSSQLLLLVVLLFCQQNVNSKSYPEAPSSICYSRGQANKCTPPFNNIIEGIEPVTTSTCGSPPKEICRTWVGNDGNIKRTCDICDQENPRKSHPARFLTDQHISNNQTCWISGPVHATKDSEVNITVSLQKRFEVYYISLQPCGAIPDSIAIYKSSDFGKTWRPWQYFSNDCYRAFRLPTSNEHDSQITAANLQEVLCVKLNRQTSDSTIAFSTTIGRPSKRPWSPALIDWMTMTDVRISLMRFPRRRESRSNNPYTSYLSPHDNFMVRDMPQHDANGGDDSSNEPVYFAFSDLAMGGNCKCNGHASRCIKSPRTGRLTCDCQHNTEGEDCERCKPSYYDQPWARATTASANECKICECNNHTSQCQFSMPTYKQSGKKHGGVCFNCRHNTMGKQCEQCTNGFFRDTKLPASHPKACKECMCNLHSDRCKFSKERYIRSGRTSGGVCEKCKHNTEGPNCLSCKDGYFRHWVIPSSHEQACKPCKCHPIGAIDGVKSICDKMTGRCPCKKGVTGVLCERCADGHRQTRYEHTPCIPDQRERGPQMALAERPNKPKPAPPKSDNPNKMGRSDLKCKKCSSQRKRIQFRKFCRKHVVFQALLQSQMVHGKYVRFEMRILNVWRRDWKARNLIPDRQSIETFALWVSTEDLRCNCPGLRVGATYLILSGSRSRTFKDRQELLLTRKSIALPYQETWNRRLTKFRRRDKHGKCKKFTRKAKIRKIGRPNKSSRNSYTSGGASSRNPGISSPYQGMSYREYQQRYPSGKQFNRNYGYYGSRK